MDQQQFQALLNVLQNGKIQQERTEVENIYQNLESETSVLSDLLVEAIQLNNTLTPLATILLRKSVMQLGGSSIIYRNENTCSNFLKLLHAFAASPTEKLSDILAGHAVLSIEFPDKYQFLEIFEFLKQAIANTEEQVRYGAFLILKSLCVIKIAKLQRFCQFDILQSVISGLQAGQAVKNVAMICLCEIVSRNEGDLQKEDRKHLRQQCLQVFVTTLNENLTEANKQADLIAKLFDNQDIDQDEIVNIMELIHQIVTSGLDSGFKAKMIEIISTLVTTHAKIDEQTLVQFNKAIILPCLKPTIQMDEWLNDLHDTQSDSLPEACKSCIELQAQMYGNKHILQLFQILLQEKSDEFGILCLIYYSLEFIKDEINEEAALSILIVTQKINQCENQSPLNICYSIKVITEMLFQCSAEVIINQQCMDIIKQLIFSTISKYSNCLKIYNGALNCLLNLTITLNNTDILQMGQYVSEIMQNAYKVPDLSIKAVSLALISVFCEVLPVSTAQSMLVEIIPQSIQDLEQFCGNLSNEHFVLKYDEEEYISRTIEMLSLAIIACPSLFDNINQIFQQFVKIMLFSVQQKFDSVATQAIVSMRRLSRLCSFDNYQQEFLSASRTVLLQKDFKVKKCDTDVDTISVDQQAKLYIQCYFEQLPQIFERQGKNLHQVFTELQQVIGDTFVYEEEMIYAKFKSQIYLFRVAETMSQEIYEHFADILIDTISDYFNDTRVSYQNFSMNYIEQIQADFTYLLEQFLKLYKQTNSQCLLTQIQRLNSLVEALAVQSYQQFTIEATLLQSSECEEKIESGQINLLFNFNTFYQNACIYYSEYVYSLGTEGFQLVSQTQDFQNWKNIVLQYTTQKELNHFQKTKFRSFIGIVSALVETVDIEISTNFLKQENILDIICEYFINETEVQQNLNLNITDLIINYCYKYVQQFNNQNANKLEFLFNNQQLQQIMAKLQYINNIIDKYASLLTKLEKFSLQLALICLQNVANIDQYFVNVITALNTDIQDDLYQQSVLEYVGRLSLCVCDNQLLLQNIFIQRVFGQHYTWFTKSLSQNFTIKLKNYFQTQQMGQLAPELVTNIQLFLQW